MNKTIKSFKRSTTIQGHREGVSRGFWKPLKFSDTLLKPETILMHNFWKIAYRNATLPLYCSEY